MMNYNHQVEVPKHELEQSEVEQENEEEDEHTQFEVDLACIIV